MENKMIDARIEISGSVVVVSAKQKKYVLKRKGFYRNGKYIKAKRFVRSRAVPIKNPYLGWDVRLKVHAELVLGASYTDGIENYVCTSIMRITETISELVNHCTQTKNNTLQFPRKLIQLPQHTS